MSEIGPRRVGAVPDAEEVRRWAGRRIDDFGGERVARAQGCYVDSGSGEPVWLVARAGWFGKLLTLPVHDCAGAGRRVWVPYDRNVVRAAPAVDPAQPLSREQELAICAHFGLHDGHGRAAEVATRPKDTITARPLPPA